MAPRSSKRKVQGLFRPRYRTHITSFLPHSVDQIILVQCQPKFKGLLYLLLRWGANCCNLALCPLTTTTYNPPTSKPHSSLFQDPENLIQLWHQAWNLGSSDLLDWSKNPFGFFHNILWKNPKELFGQPNKIDLAAALSPLYLETYKLKKKNLGFPGGAEVENLPANAGDTGSSPGLGRSHMPRSSWAREPQLLSLRIWSLCPATGGAAIVKGPHTAMKSGPCTAMRSGPHLP